MKLAEMKDKLKAVEAKRTAKLAEANTMYDAALKDNKGDVPEAELVKITALKDEAGRFMSEISFLKDRIAIEENLDRPATATHKGNLASELDYSADNFSDMVSRVHGGYGKPRFVSCGGNMQKAAQLCYDFTVWLAANAPKALFKNGNNSWAIKRAQERGLDVNALHQEDGMTSGSNLVPPQFIWELINLKELFGVFRRNAMIWPMSEDVANCPRRSGGLTYYWVGEGAAGTTSTMVLDQVKLVAKKLMVLAVATNELYEDAAISIGDLILGEAAYQLSSGEDDAGFLGDGTSTYGGITGVANKITGLSGTVSQISGLQVLSGTGSWSSNALADYNAIVGLLPQFSDIGSEAKWYASRTYFYGTMQRVAAAAGGVTFNEIIDGVRRPMFLGYPLEFAQKLPRFWATSQVPVLFGNLKQAAKFGDRRQIAIANSTDASIDGNSLFVNDLRAWRVTERIDINVHDVGNASSTASSKNAGPMCAGITATS